MQDLAEAQSDLEKLRQLLGGMIATIRIGDDRANYELMRLVKSGCDLSQLAAHVRNERRSNYEIQQVYDTINFEIDGEEELPSPSQILLRGQHLLPTSGPPDMSEPDIGGFAGVFPLYGMDGHR